jgi:hypothetical protein
VRDSLHHGCLPQRIPSNWRMAHGPQVSCISKTVMPTHREVRAESHGSYESLRVASEAPYGFKIDSRAAEMTSLRSGNAQLGSFYSWGYEIFQCARYGSASLRPIIQLCNHCRKWIADQR